MPERLQEEIGTLKKIEVNLIKNGVPQLQDLSIATTSHFYHSVGLKWHDYLHKST